MSAVEVVNDLIELERLAELERDDARRHRLLEIHHHVADREGGAKVSEAARVLDLSLPTVRSWIDAGVLEPVPGRKPVQVTLTSLATASRTLDQVRAQASDQRLLADVMRVLRDRAALHGDDLIAGIDDLTAGRRSKQTIDRLDELVPQTRRAKRSKSS